MLWDLRKNMNLHNVYWNYYEPLFLEAGTVKWSEDYFLQILQDLFNVSKNKAVEMVKNYLDEPVTLSDGRAVVLKKESLYNPKTRKDNVLYFFLVEVPPPVKKENFPVSQIVEIKEPSVKIEIIIHTYGK